MATSESAARGKQSAQSVWVRPLVPLLIVTVAAIALLYAGGFVASA